MSYIFLDESGDLGSKDKLPYFIIGAFTTDNPKTIKKQFRSWQHSRFPKKFKFQSELKFSDRRIDEKLRLKTLQFFSSLNIDIRYSYLLKKNVPKKYRRKNKLQTGFLYSHIISRTLELFLPIKDLEFKVFCDNRHLQGISKAQFKEIIICSLLPQLPKKTVIQIETINSAANENVQIADWVAGALSHYHNKKIHGPDFYRVLRKNILSSAEMFKNHWIKKQKTQSSDRVFW